MNDVFFYKLGSKGGTLELVWRVTVDCYFERDDLAAT